MGLTFKDIAKQDVNNIFFCDSEFSEQHTINGKPMHAIIDENELMEREQAYIVTQRTDGIYRKRLLIYVPAAEYGPKPVPGSRINLDGKRLYIVEDCIDEDGVYSITLGANNG